MSRHSTGISKKNRKVEFERQAEEQKQQDSVYTLSRIKHLFTQASFYFGFKRQKFMDCFSSSTSELATFAI